VVPLPSAPQARIAHFKEATMADPVTLGVIITGLVGAYKAYTEYKAATAKATETKAPPPAKTPEAMQGEQAALIIRAGVQQHGEPKDVKVVEHFEDDPETYQEAMQKALARLAERSQPFA
jgi:catalase (peroxidase I)